MKPLAETLAKVAACAGAMGATRIADTTDLDCLGIPNYSVISPLLNYPPTPGGISVMSGKGTTRLQAKVSALMETAEHYSGRRHRRPTIVGSYRQLVQQHNVAHPASFVVPGSNEYHPDEMTEWVMSRSLVHRDVVLVPAWLVFCPYEPQAPSLRHWSSSTNGLASGNTIEEATLHALYEVIERDAEALALHSSDVRSLDLGSIASGPNRDLLDTFSRHGIQVEVKDLTQDIPVPTFMAIIVDRSLPSICYVNGGKGTHLDPSVALSRALTEASQSRVVGMGGIREDMSSKRRRMEQDFDKLLADNAKWYQPWGERCRFDGMPNRATDNVVDDLHAVLDDLRMAGLEDVYLVDLTRAELDIPVARVIVPGLDYEVEGNWVGPRLARCYANKSNVDARTKGPE